MFIDLLLQDPGNHLPLAESQLRTLEFVFELFEFSPGEDGERAGVIVDSTGDLAFDGRLRTRSDKVERGEGWQRLTFCGFSDDAAAGICWLGLQCRHILDLFDLAHEIIYHFLHIFEFSSQFGPILA